MISIVRRLSFVGIFLGLATPAGAQDSVLELLFDAPHRSAESLWSMPEIGETQGPFTKALAAAVARDTAVAREHAAAVGYEVIEREEDGNGYTLLMEKDRAGIGPTIAIAHNPIRDAVIQAPHPIKDRATDRQAAVLFLQLGARALILSGANRCAAKEDSPCSGMTRVCGGGRNPYRTSDPAHNTETLFHTAHLYFSNEWPQSIAVQPHGFGNGGSSVWFVISDGTNEKRPGDTGLTGRVRDAVRAAIGKERAVSCQDPDDRSIQTRWLCATTTVQGRTLNFSKEACRVAAKKSSGRFLHIEQTYEEVRRGYGLDWENLSEYPASAAILAALSKELPCVRPDCTRDP